MTFVAVLSATELEPGDVTQVTVNGIDIAIARDSDGSWHALEDQCSHGNVALSDGDIDEGGIECWKHGSVFDLETGKPRSLPAITPVQVFPIKVDGESVLIDVESPKK